MLCAKGVLVWGYFGLVLLGRVSLAGAMEQDEAQGAKSGMLKQPMLMVPVPTPVISQESSIWVPTLNYTYKGKIVYDPSPAALNSNKTDAWHSQRASYIEEVFSVFEDPNVAVARLSLVYRPTEEGKRVIGSKGLSSKSFFAKAEYFVKHYDIPSLFMSGWSEQSLKENKKLKKGVDQDKELQKNLDSLKFIGEDYQGALNVLYKKPIFIKNSYPTRTSIAPGYLRELISIYNNQDKASKLDRINKTLTALQGYGQYFAEQGDPSKLEDFHKRFYDSEQGLFLSLQNFFLFGKQDFGELVEVIPAGSAICLIKLDIASYYDICFDCSDTGFRQIEARRGFVNSLVRALKEAGYEVPGADDAENLAFIEVSSQRPTQKDIKPEWNSRKDNTSYKNKQAILKKHNLLYLPKTSKGHKGWLAAEKLPPYIVQINLSS